jgi:hypothetical protein
MPASPTMNRTPPRPPRAASRASAATSISRDRPTSTGQGTTTDTAARSEPDTVRRSFATVTPWSRAVDLCAGSARPDCASPSGHSACARDDEPRAVCMRSAVRRSSAPRLGRQSVRWRPQSVW